MDCPVCKEAMIVFEHEQVEVDHCLSCRGVWLDGGELELLLKGAERKNQLLTSFVIANGSREKKRRCPICRKKMEKVMCGNGHRVLLDRCSKGDGVWFDVGELNQVIKEAISREQTQAFEWLRSLFREPSPA